MARHGAAMVAPFPFNQGGNVDVLNWMSDNPILTFFLAYMAMFAVIGVATAIMGAATDICQTMINNRNNQDKKDDEQ